MEWMTVQDAGKQWGITARRTQYLCAAGKVNGAQKLGNIWIIPQETQKPIDGRTKAVRLEKEARSQSCHANSLHETRR